MNKLLLTIMMIAIVSAISACGSASQVGAAVTGYSTHCVEGVKYIQFLNGASVMHNVDGSIKTC